MDNALIAQDGRLTGGVRGKDLRDEALFAEIGLSLVGEDSAVVSGEDICSVGP